MASVPSIDAVQVPDGAHIIDVREDDEWAAGHIPGAVHVPLAEVPARLGEIPEGEQVVVVCRSGNRSGRATEWLNSNGFDVLNLEGGMHAWARVGKPIVSEDGTPPRVI